MRELVLGTGSFGNEIFRLLAPGILLTNIVPDKFIKLFLINGNIVTRQARPRGRHCDQLSKMLVFMELLLRRDDLT